MDGMRKSLLRKTGELRLRREEREREEREVLKINSYLNVEERWEIM